MKVFLQILISVFSVAAFCFPGVSAGEEHVIFHHDFRVKNSLSAVGWEVAGQEQDWIVNEDGFLENTKQDFRQSGALLRKSAPFLKRGYFQFDLKIRGGGTIEWNRYAGEFTFSGLPPEAVENREILLQVFLFGEITAFNKFKGGSAEDRLIRGSRDYWSYIAGGLETGEWRTFRIFFDFEEKIFEFYYDDMSDPVNINSELNLERKDREDYFIGFLGGVSPLGETQNYINNVKLVEIK